MPKSRKYAFENYISKSVNLLRVKKLFLENLIIIELLLYFPQIFANRIAQKNLG